MNIAFKIMLLGSPQADYTELKTELQNFSPLSVFVLAEDEATFQRKIKWFAPNLIVSVYDLIDLKEQEKNIGNAKKALPYLPFVFVIHSEKFEQLKYELETISELVDTVILQEELTKLPGYLGVVLKQKQKEITAAEDRINQINKLHFRLNKAMHILETTDSYKLRNEMIDLVRSLKTDLALFNGSSVSN